MLTALARQRLIYPHSLLSHLSHRHSLQLQLQRHCHPFTPNLHRPSSTISDPTPKSPSASSPVAKRARLEDVQDSVDNLKMAFGATTPIPAAAAAGPPGWAEEAKSYGSFKLLQSFPIQYAPIGVAKWKSEKTGLSVVVGNHESPVTNGHFAIASEIFDDTGRPHTLEHLIFLGSKKYPFKGVLDQLANRAGSNGTNAWTANDHTAYTIATAGAEGFLKMLPIYIDHILHPTITDAGFVTEVHHINGKGEDAGVVYSEMQARENTAGDLMCLQAQRMMYPQSSAYRSETGGLMSALRVLTAEQIREYHRSYYVPHNLCLVIDGAVSLPDLFRVLNDEVEPMILEHLQQAPNWKRPFVETTTSDPITIKESQQKVVEFMEEDESMGDVGINWFGPGPMDYRTGIALKLLGNYLSFSATSPLQKEFVEIAKPYCSGISFYAEDRVRKNELSCFIADVPVKYGEKMRDMVVERLRKIVESEGIDMKKMGIELRKDKRKLLNSMETSVSSIMADCAIGDFLYGDLGGKDLPTAFNDLEDYKILDQWTDADWRSLLDKYYVSQPSITTVGKPSAALSAKIEQEEKDRIAQRQKELGEDKLKQLEKDLEDAKKESDRPPPDDMIASFPITDPKTLTWVPVETAINNAPGQKVKSDDGQVQQHIEADGDDLPFQAHFAHVKSNFVSISALFDTLHVPAEIRPYFAILQAAMFSSGVIRSDGTVLTHEQVVDRLNDFAVSKQAYFRGTFTEVFTLEFRVEKADYEKALGWMRDLVTGLRFEADRLEVIVAKLLQELPYEKRDGNRVASAYLCSLAFDIEKSTSEACSLLKSLEFVPATAQALKENPDVVIAKLEEARKYLLDSSILRVSVKGDVLSLPEPRSAIKRSFLPIESAVPLQELSKSSQTLSPLGQNPAKKCILVPMPAIEGSYSMHYAKGLIGFDHPDTAALKLAVATLNASESYLWKAVRGSGLAYGASVSNSSESGLSSYSVYRSPNAKLAYEEAKKVLVGLVDGSIELEQAIVDGARSSLTYSYARASETVMAAAGTAYLDMLRGVSKDNNKRLLEQFPSVTLDQIREAIRKYLLPVFSADTAIGAVTVSTGKADEVEQGFKDLGFEVERRVLPALGGEEGSEDGEESESGSDSGDEDTNGPESKL